MEKSSAKKIAFFGVVSALMFVCLLVETYVFTAFMGNFTPAILTLPLAVALSLFSDKKGMFIGGTIFGCCSFFLALIIGNVIFVNPLISILPRVFIGIVAYLVCALVKKIFKNSSSAFLTEILPYSIAGAFGILTNTVFTITMMWIFDVGQLAAVMTVILSLNFLAEVVGAIILVPVYSKILKKVAR